MARILWRYWRNTDNRENAPKTDVFFGENAPYYISFLGENAPSYQKKS